MVTLLAVLGVGVLGYYKKTRLDRLASQSLKLLDSRHRALVNLFQSSFYFFFDEQFIPGVQEQLRTTDSLESIDILSSQGQWIFSSSDPRRPTGGEEGKELKAYPDTRISSRLTQSQPSVLHEGFGLQILVPSGQYAILYKFSAQAVRNEMLAIALVWIALLFLSYRIALRLERQAATGQVKLWGLRAKFLVTIVVINLITGAIVFFTLNALQTQEETQRIQKESILFAQFSTAQVISDFSSFYYFNFADKFLPGVKSIIAANENMIGLRIISRKNETVLFDSEAAQPGPASPTGGTDPGGSAAFDEELKNELLSRDLVARLLDRSGQKILSVVNTYRNENREALFYVEYAFAFNTLERSLGVIRRQILVDLVPAMALGLVIAIVFANLLIAPVRRLMIALQRVAAGDYNATVPSTSKDEIGELVNAFNMMTGELRKKRELQKFLSNSTYRQIMQAFESNQEGQSVKIGGTRTEAAILFCDIRDFVGHCEHMEAEEVTTMLNDYFSEMVDVVHRSGGEVDKFIGDALLAVFYSNEATDTSMAIQSIYCGLEMRDRLKDFNLKRAGEGRRPIEIGIGITQGQVISGPIGSKDRLDFTVIGDVVNLASRIEKLSKQGKHTRIVFSNHVQKRVAGLVDHELLTAEPIRGKDEEVQVYELIRIKELSQLIAGAKSGAEDFRARCLELLGQSRNMEASRYVRTCVADPSETIRLRAVLSATKLAESITEARSDTIDELVKRLPLEDSVKVLSAIISALGKLCRDDRIFAIAPFLNHREERVIANTIEALGSFPSPRITDMLLPFLGSANNRIKANAALALFSAGRTAVIDTLKPMLLYSDPLMRSSAAFAIGEVCSLAQREDIQQALQVDVQRMKVVLAELQVCVPMLVTLLRDADPMVKRQAIIALGKIRDRSSVLPLIDAVDPSKDGREMLQDVAQALRSIGSHKLVRDLISRLS